MSHLKTIFAIHAVKCFNNNPIHDYQVKRNYILLSALLWCFRLSGLYLNRVSPYLCANYQCLILYQFVHTVLAHMCHYASALYFIVIQNGSTEIMFSQCSSENIMWYIRTFWSGVQMWCEHRRSPFNNLQFCNSEICFCMTVVYIVQSNFVWTAIAQRYFSLH